MAKTKQRPNFYAIPIELLTTLSEVPAPDVNENGAFQFQVSALDYNSYIGVIGIGRITRGKVTSNTPVSIIGKDNKVRRGRILQLFRLLGLERTEINTAAAGDIIAISGMDELNISDTLCDPDTVEAIPALPRWQWLQEV